MSDSDEDYSDMFPMLPCEFCEGLFAPDDLILHQSGCELNDELLNFAPAAPVFRLDEPPPVATPEVRQPPTPPKKEAKVQQPVPPVKVEDSLQTSPKASTSETAKESNASKKLNAPYAPEFKTPKDVPKSEPSLDDAFVQLDDESEKLLTYGRASSKKRAEEEKPTFKAPRVNYSDKKPETRYNVVSDGDEDGESLEDFWKRAEIKLSRMRVK